MGLEEVSEAAALAVTKLQDQLGAAYADLAATQVFSPQKEYLNQLFIAGHVSEACCRPGAYF
jgi:hypothetical protein